MSVSNQEMKQQYDSILQRIKTACHTAGREVDSVTLVAVSKTQPIEIVTEAINLGMRVFGENKPQEIRDKCSHFEATLPTLNPPLVWHMIGNIQKNKIKYLIDTCELIHSVDSIEILEAINHEASKRNKIVPILLQVNISKEVTKNGLSVDELYQIITQLQAYTHIHVLGLMTIPPFVEDPEKNRSHFRQLREVFIDIKSKNIDNVTMNYLSMGMTDDFEVAIEEGATHIRVGTGIFGKRNYN